MFVGDGLTMARMKSFDELLNTNVMGHVRQYDEKALMLRKEGNESHCGRYG